MNEFNIEKYWAMIDEKLNFWLETGIKHLPNLAVAIIFIILFSLVARVASKFLRNILRKTLDSQQIADLLASIFKVCFMLSGIFICLDFIGLKGTVTSLLAGAGIIGLAIGFAFQDMTENLIAGIAMGIRKPFRAGDIIESEGVFGTVKNINLRNTIVETFYGQMEIVPNKVLFRQVLTNYSIYGERRLEVPVGISYADDPEEATKVITEAINQCDFVIKKDETDVFAEKFGASSVDLLVWFWIRYPGEAGFMTARHKAIVTIKRALESADIQIPFPIRSLDFGAKGGTTLKHALESEQ